MKTEENFWKRRVMHIGILIRKRWKELFLPKKDRFYWGKNFDQFYTEEGFKSLSEKDRFRLKKSLTTNHGFWFCWKAIVQFEHK